MPADDDTEAALDQLIRRAGNIPAAELRTFLKTLPTVRKKKNDITDYFLSPNVDTYHTVLGPFKLAVADWDSVDDQFCTAAWCLHHFLVSKPQPPELACLQPPVWFKNIQNGSCAAFGGLKVYTHSKPIQNSLHAAIDPMLLYMSRADSEGTKTICITFIAQCYDSLDIRYCDCCGPNFLFLGYQRRHEAEDGNNIACQLPDLLIIPRLNNCRRWRMSRYHLLDTRGLLPR